MILTLLLVVLSSFFVSCFAEAPSVQTKLGTVIGFSNNVEFRGQKYTVQQYLGIPYAKSPTGARRFQKPEALDKFEADPLEATKYGSGCPQIDVLSLKLRSTDENCLFLNIFVPDQRPDQESGHAVMVFVHGGGFNNGAGNMVSPVILASVGNVIVVTINYRLGLFGFLSLGNGKNPGNMGLWDQQLAFTWVSENLHAFGGDASRITLFGESAGGVSVFFQGMYPPNKGLFQNIISQSGAPTMPMGVSKDNLKPFKYLAEKLGCNGETVDEFYDCVLSKDTETIINILQNEFEKHPQTYNKVLFYPTIDGEMIKEDPMASRANGFQNLKEQIDFLRTLRLINGVNGAEGGMFAFFTFVMMGGNMDDVVLSHKDFKNMHIPMNLLRVVPEEHNIPEVLEEVVAFQYIDWSSPTNARREYVNFMGDIYFNVPSYEHSLIQANSSESRGWLYSFDADIEKHVMPTPSWLGTANHGDDMAPTFGYHIDYSDMESGKYKPPDWEAEMSERMMKYWSSFAKSG